MLIDGLGADFSGRSLNVGMVNFRDELYLGWFEGIGVIKVEIDYKFSTKERSRLRSVDDQVPTPQVVIDELDRNSWNRSSL